MNIYGLGLRTQILIALSVALLASFVLLGLASVQLAQKARNADRRQDAMATARLMVAAMNREGGLSRERFVNLVDAVLGHGGIQGAELRMQGTDPLVRGLVGSGSYVEAPFAGGQLRFWIRAADPQATAPLANLLLLYVAITGAAILLLAYVSLTFLIVRPLEQVTRASERLADGREHVGVPVQGAAEVARLAVAFNEMAKQLRTERAALEARLRDLERKTHELREAQDQVVGSERLASVGRLSAGVAHEIGNPLAAILGLVELLRSTELNEKERDEFLARIQGETERIHKIIRELLDFARQAREDAATDVSSDLVQVVEDAVRLVAPQKDLRTVTIERRFEEILPRDCGSADRLTQVILNLLLNAADAIEEDGTIRLEVEFLANSDQVSLVIADSGPGIRSDVLEHIFEPFVTTKPPGKGTGLGLAVCYTIVERIGGGLHASNPSEGGARFEVRLPVWPGDVRHANA